MELTTEYSSWFLILCAILAGLYTFFLYGKNKQNAELPVWVVQVLSFLRFASTFILAVLLLNPIVQKWITQSEPPIIILAQDNSASIVNNADSSFYKNEYLHQLEELKSKISENYKVVALNFGDEVLVQDSGVTFTDKRTSYAQLFDEIDMEEIRPQFNGSYNRWRGLQILVNDTEQTDVYFDESSLECTDDGWCVDVCTEIIDNFGLDKADVLKYQPQMNWSEIKRGNIGHFGFNAWWMLQHQRNYVPFKTKINVKSTICGSF